MPIQPMILKAEIIGVGVFMTSESANSLSVGPEYIVVVVMDDIADGTSHQSHGTETVV